MRHRSRSTSFVLPLLGSGLLSITGCQGPDRPPSPPTCVHTARTTHLDAPPGTPIRPWFDGLERLGPDTTRRAWLVLARRALPHTPPELGLAGLAAAVEAWVLHPSPETARVARLAHVEVNERLLEPENMAVLTEAFASDQAGVVEEAYFAALHALWAALPDSRAADEGIDPLGSALELEQALLVRSRAEDPQAEAGEALRRAISRDLSGSHEPGQACHADGPCAPVVAAESPRPRS